MRPVAIDPARGADTSIDPRVAPMGSIARVENFRVDKAGRLVLRNAYASLGGAVRDTVSSNVRPLDLHNVDGRLLALGNHDAAQTGIRALYKYVPDNARPWVAESYLAPALTADWSLMSVASRVRQVSSANDAAETDIAMTDCAVSDDGLYLAQVTSRSGTVEGQITIVHLPSNTVIWQQTSIGRDRNRVLYSNGLFHVYGWTSGTTTIATGTLNPASTSYGLGVALATSITTAAAAPGNFDVALYEGTNDHLIVFATASGYTWIRRTPGVGTVSTANVTSLALAPVSICGATGENIHVLNVRTTSGAELRSFDPTSGALAVGPTNLDTSGQVMVWVGLSRISATLLACSFLDSSSLQQLSMKRVSQVAHTTSLQAARQRCFAVTKPRVVAGVIVQWIVPGLDVQRNYVLVDWGIQTTSTSTDAQPIAVAQQGGAKQSQSSAVEAWCPQVAVFGTRTFAGLVSFDPRDKTYRGIVVSADVCSSDRRQGVAVGGVLYLAGGVITSADNRFASELGFMNAVNITLTPNLGGSKTLLGTYVVHVIVRNVAAGGLVTQSAPSAPKTITLAGGNNRITIGVQELMSRKGRGVADALGATVYYDVYCTEAGGSIPRLTQSVRHSTISTPGSAQTIQEDTADSVTQSGAPMYTQGADGSVSGRLPLTIPSPGELVAESDGKIIVGALQSANQLQLSLEGRPGETQGFVNDDLYYVTNPEPLTAIVAGTDGRRYLFSATTVRELLGAGPNAAGIGELSEPVLLSNVMGAKDWRSVVQTEMGILFQNANERLCLLPLGGGQPMDISEGISELLLAFPIVTSASRIEHEKLVSFTLQSRDGLDGRLLHLDLRSSGMGKSGWRGCWIIDRVAAFEATQFPEIIEERFVVFTSVTASPVSYPLPRGLRIGDRVVQISCLDASVSLTPALLFSISVATSGGVTQYVHERRITNAADLTAMSVATTTASIGSLPAAGMAAVFKLYVIRGSDVAVAGEAATATHSAQSSFALATLTPTWGAAKNLWLTGGQTTTDFLDAGNPNFRVPPAGFARHTRQGFTAVGFPTNQSLDTAFATRQFEGASLSGLSWTMSTSLTGLSMLYACKPATGAGTPLRASVGYQGRLVVCNDTQVVQNDGATFADFGSLAIKGEWESADIYPMGAGGHGRHLLVQILGEILGYCQIYTALSYDGGVNWVAQRDFRLAPVTGAAIGSVQTLQFVPSRRKVEGVRLRIVVADDGVSATGPTPGFALNQVTLWFEDLAGPVKARPRGAANAGAFAGISRR